MCAHGGVRVLGHAAVCESVCARVDVRHVIAEELCMCGTVCSLQGNRIGDVGAQAIAGALMHVPQLTSLQYVCMPYVCVRVEESDLVVMQPCLGPCAHVWKCET